MGGGNGVHIFTWVDHWHPHGSSIKRYGSRIVYDAASSLNSRPSEYIANEGWNFPNPASPDLIRVVQSLPILTLQLLMVA